MLGLGRHDPARRTASRRRPDVRLGGQSGRPPGGRPPPPDRGRRTGREPPRSAGSPPPPGRLRCTVLSARPRAARGASTRQLGPRLGGAAGRPGVPALVVLGAGDVVVVEDQGLGARRQQVGHHRRRRELVDEHVAGGGVARIVLHRDGLTGQLVVGGLGEDLRAPAGGAERRAQQQRVAAGGVAGDQGRDELVHRGRGRRGPPPDGPGAGCRGAHRGVAAARRECRHHQVVGPLGPRGAPSPRSPRPDRSVTQVAGRKGRPGARSASAGRLLGGPGRRAERVDDQHPAGGQPVGGQVQQLPRSPAAMPSTTPVSTRAPRAADVDRTQVGQDVVVSQVGAVELGPLDPARAGGRPRRRPRRARRAGGPASRRRPGRVEDPARRAGHRLGGGLPPTRRRARAGPATSITGALGTCWASSWRPQLGQLRRRAGAGPGSPRLRTGSTWWVIYAHVPQAERRTPFLTTAPPDFSEPTGTTGSM